MAVGVCGCGRKAAPAPLAAYKTSGKLTVRGEPGAGLVVVLNPQGGKYEPRHQTRGVVDAKGEFQLSTYSEGDGAPEGTYTLFVPLSPADSTKNLNPEWAALLGEYDKGHKTFPTVTIKPQDGNVLEPIDLK